MLKRKIVQVLGQRIEIEKVGNVKLRTLLSEINEERKSQIHGDLFGDNQWMKHSDHSDCWSRR